MRIQEPSAAQGFPVDEGWEGFSGVLAIGARLHNLERGSCSSGATARVRDASRVNEVRDASGDGKSFFRMLLLEASDTFLRSL